MYVVATLFLILLYNCKQISSLQCVSVTQKYCFNEKLKFENTVNWGYNSTYYPTLSGLNSDSEVSERFNFLYPLIKTECSKYIRQFACSLHQSACIDVGVLFPCKELCEKVHEDCFKVASSFGIKWSEHMIQCSLLPSMETNNELVEKKVALKETKEDEHLISRTLEMSQDNILINKVCIPPSNEENSLKIINEIAKKPIKVINETSVTNSTIVDVGIWCPAELRSPKSFSGYSFLDIEGCSPPCPNMYVSEGELVVLKGFILFVSLICSIVSLFTLLTFLINTDRFRYPERPIIFYSASYFAVSSLHVAAFFINLNASCNERILDDDNQVIYGFTVVEGIHQRLCTLIFMLLYFFTMKGTVWWVILTFTWLLAAAFKWAKEAIEKHSTLYHIVALLLPALQTTAAVLHRKVEGDNITGLCYVGIYDTVGVKYLLLVPMAVYLSIGIIILFTGFFCLNRVRKSLNNDEDNKQKLANFMLRIGIFSLLFIVPQLILIAVYLYEESNRLAWEAKWFSENCDTFGVPCPVKSTEMGKYAQENKRPPLLIFYVKYTMTLVVALPPLFWIAGRKTYNSWKRCPSKNICFKEKNSKSKNLNNTKTYLLNNTTIGGHTTDTNNTQIMSKGLTFDNSKLNFNKEQAINGWNDFMANYQSSTDSAHSSDITYSDFDSSTPDRQEKFVKSGGSRKRSQPKIKVPIERHHNQSASRDVIYENTLTSKELETKHAASREVEQQNPDFKANEVKISSRMYPGSSSNGNDKLKLKPERQKPPLPPRPQKKISTQNFDENPSFSSSLNINSHRNKICDRSDLRKSIKANGQDKKKGKSLDNVFTSLT